MTHVTTSAVSNGTQEKLDAHAIEAVFLKERGETALSYINSQIYHMKSVIEDIQSSEEEGSNSLMRALKRRLLMRLNAAKAICHDCNVELSGEVLELVTSMEEAQNKINI